MVYTSLGKLILAVSKPTYTEIYSEFETGGLVTFIFISAVCSLYSLSNVSVSRHKFK